MSRVNVEVDGDEIQVTTPYDEDWKQEARELGGRWDKANGCWVFSTDDYTVPEIEAKLRQHFPRDFR